MISHLRRLGRMSPALPAALIVCLLPAAVRAETLNIQNALPAGVQVNVTSVSVDPNNPNAKIVNRDKPAKLAPGDTTQTTLPGDKIITIVDGGNPNIKLIVKAVPAGTEDRYFKIVLAGKPGMQKPILEEVPPPKKP
jgi:hypothetical protein